VSTGAKKSGGSTQVLANPSESLDLSGKYSRLTSYGLRQINKEISSQKESIDPKKIAENIYEFAIEGDPSKILDPSFHEHLDLTKEEIIDELTKLEGMDRVRSLLFASKVLNELEQIVEAKKKDQEDVSVEYSSSSYKSAPIPNNSFINSSDVNVTLQLPYFDTAELITGVYRSGDPGVAATPYVRLEDSVYEYSFEKSVQASIVGALGSATILPEENFNDNLIFYLRGSLQGFLGLEKSLGDFSLRSGAQITPALFTARNSHDGIDIPIHIGGSAAYKITPGMYIALGAITEFVTVPNEIQDPSTFRPTPNYVDLFGLINSSIGAVEGGVRLYRDVEEIRVSYSSPTLGIGDHFWMRGMLSGQMSVDGVPAPIAPPSIFLTLDFGIPIDGDVVKRVEASTSLDMTAGISASGEEDAPNGYSYQTGNDFIVGNVRDAFFNQQGKRFYVCSDVKDVRFRQANGDDNMICRELGADEVEAFKCPKDSDQCRFEEHYGRGIYRQYNLRRTEMLGYNNIRDIYRYESVGKPKFVMGDNILSALYNSEDLSTFVRSMRGASYEDQISALHFLAYLAYETYDETGTVSIKGMGKVNSASNNEKYKAARNSLFNPDKSEHLTVCRGIAPLITEIAGEWGLEAYSVVVHTGNMGHVVSMVREKDGRLDFINWGDEAVYSRSKTITEAIQDFVRIMDFPPQTLFDLYGPDGTFVKRIKTNEGRMLEEATTPPDKINLFLRHMD